MNAGVIFTRCYTILKDRDITGELKEVWNAVLAIRDSEQRPQETWIDAQPSVPQYPQNPEQQQQQQEYTPQPPQYHSSIAYGATMSGDGMHFDSYGMLPRNTIIPQNEQIYQSGQIIPQQYHGNDPRIPLDRYNYRERGRGGAGGGGGSGGSMVPSISQSNCPTYPTAQYQFQQLPRQIIPQYVNHNVHPNPNLAYGPTPNPPINNSSPFPLHIPFQQQQQQQPRMDNPIFDIRFIPHQQQQPQSQPQMHLNHAQPQYESGSFHARTAGRRHMGAVQKNNVPKKQLNSPTHASCGNCETKEDQPGTGKPKSPVKVLQRGIIGNKQQNVYNNFSEKNKTPAEKTEETKSATTPNSGEDPKKSNDPATDSTNVSAMKEDIDNRESACVVDDAPSGEEKNSVKLEKPSPETKESETKVAQQSNVQTKPGKFARRNARAGKATSSATKTDKQNSPAFASESPKRSQPTMSIFKNVFKIPSASGEDTSGKRKTNGQVKANAKATCENEEIQQGYTILKKDVQEEMASEIAQISIQDCKDATEVVGPVLS